MLGDCRIGQGYDVHRLTFGRDLILGGVKIEYQKGLLGHSDADVLTHAICDALLGACALGDIGQHFPDSDPQYKGINSLMLLSSCMTLLMQNGYTVSNVDSTVIAQEPKLKPYIEQIRINIANTMNLPIDRVSVKATTEEHLGFTGSGDGIAAQAVVLVNKMPTGVVFL